MSLMEEMSSKEEKVKDVVELRAKKAKEDIDEREKGTRDETKS